MTASVPPVPLRDLAEEGRRRFDLPGLALAITDQAGTVTSFAASGSVVAGAETPPTPRTAWRVASITKPITASALFQLRDRGRLELDDPLVRHLPEFAAVRPTAGPIEGVTLRRMLLHASGLPTEPLGLNWSAARYPSTEQILAALPELEIALEPGTQFKYSNLAYGLLGEVIARVSRMPYREYVRREIFEPLAMVDTGFEREGRPAESRLADAFVLSRPLGGPHRPSPYGSLEGLTPAGQLITTIADLARWIAAQFPGAVAPHVLADETLREMQAAQGVRASAVSERTLGWELTHDLGGPVHGHGGGIHGFGSYLAFHVPSRIGVVALSNLWPSRGAAGQLAAEVMGALLGGTRPAPEGAPLPAPATDPVPEAVAPLLGAWFAEPGFPVRTEWRAGGLWLLPGDTGEYALHAPTRLAVEDSRRLRALDGRAAGEALTFAHDGASFAIGGFVYERA